MVLNHISDTIITCIPKFIFFITVSCCFKEGRKEGRKEMFYLTTHSTHFIYGYMASDVVKDHSDSERGKPAAATWATLFN